ncbi:histidinol dehydrogenase [Leucobacter komagatae]|uniref:Histidinol dehydrogenase n=1 Tax=Leucobacter komagatae TaxID=55969 RepID=A0A0D0IIW2_9MICO|nr:histidinol dehydrogenase [Leucobacter komagatae]KIP51589.1 histidinol dehydrogenase [Leucobacter komagatae]
MFHLKKPRQTDAQSTDAQATVTDTVKTVIADIENRGDAALRDYSVKFDSYSPESFRLSESEIQEIISGVDPQTLEDIQTVQRNVERFAKLQRDSITDFESEVEPGVFLGQKNIPVGAVGAYVPGGRYPLLASAHMTIVTAKVAGVQRVIAATPAPNGEIPAASVAAIHYAGADEIYLLGGVQAIAALAVGTETIDPVDVIAGPGNAFVAEAKRQLFGRVGIDLFAGPTEVLIIGDDSTDPFLAAVDLLSQAEHGPDSPAVYVTTSQANAAAVIDQVERQLEVLPTREIAGKAWETVGEVIVADNLEEAFRISDEYASEHVQVLTAEPRLALEQLQNYGALFLGDRTCVSYGDKVIGTNHVLPTMRAARYTGGLWVGKYLKTVTYQEVRTDEASAALGALLGRAARAERFEGHARSGDIRAARFTGEWPAWSEGLR